MKTNVSRENHAPSGDVLEYHDGLQPSLRVQKDSALSGSKALHFARIPVDAPDSSRWLRFKGIGTDLTQTLRFSFTGQNHSADVLIEVSDRDGHPMARIRIYGDNWVYDDAYGISIADVDYDPHTIVFAMFTSRLEYNVTIITASGTIKTENKPMITDNLLSFSNPAHPMISFRHIPESVLGPSYAIGSVNISRKEP